MIARRILPALLLFAATAAFADEGPTTRPDEQAKAAPNTWVEFEPAFSGAPDGGQFVAVSWNKMVYDSRGKRAIVIDRWKDKVRGHSIYANAVVAIDPSTARADVIKLTNHHVQSKEKGGYRTVPMPANEAEPTPVDRHPYGCVAYSEHDHSVYLGPGANRSAGKHPRDFWRFDLAERKWHRINEVAPPAAKGNYLERVMCYDAAAKAIVYYDSSGKGSTWLFDVAKQEWRQPNPENEPRAGMAAAMAYDSKREAVYIFAGPGSGDRWNTPGRELWRYSVKQNEWTRLADAPVPARAPKLAYNSRHDTLLAVCRRGKDEPPAVLLYDPAADKWSEMPRAEDAKAWPGGSWDTLIYDASRDLFVAECGAYGGLKWMVMHYRPEAGQ